MSIIRQIRQSPEYRELRAEAQAMVAKVTKPLESKIESLEQRIQALEAQTQASLTH
jgi:hypothetical protein